MLAINWDDVIGVIQSISTHLIVGVIAIIVGIIAIVAVKGLKKPLKRLVRGEVLVAMVLVIVVLANLICTGPMNTLLTSVAGKPVSKIDAKTTEEATDLVSEIGTELSKKLEYKYPDKLENDIRKYLAGLKPQT